MFFKSERTGLEPVRMVLETIILPLNYRSFIFKVALIFFGLFKKSRGIA
jgi:hypothetical protein